MGNRRVAAVAERGSRFDFAPVFSNARTVVVAVGALAVVLTLEEVDVSPLRARGPTSGDGVRG